MHMQLIYLCLPVGSLRIGSPPAAPVSSPCLLGPGCPRVGTGGAASGTARAAWPREEATCSGGTVEWKGS